MHMNNPAWYLNKLVFDESWEFSGERNINRTAEKHVKEVPGKAWVSLCIGLGIGVFLGV